MTAWVERRKELARRKWKGLRKGMWDDHLDELSAIVRGENNRKVMSPVRGWPPSNRKKDKRLRVDKRMPWSDGAE